MCKKNMCKLDRDAGLARLEICMNSHLVSSQTGLLGLNCIAGVHPCIHLFLSERDTRVISYAQQGRSSTGFSEDSNSMWSYKEMTRLLA